MNHQEIEAERLTVYCTDGERYEGTALHEFLLKKAAEMKMGGVTVMRGQAGYGHHRRFHYQHLLAMSGELPVIVEMVETVEKIESFLAAVAEPLTGYTYIRERVRWHLPKR